MEIVVPGNVVRMPNMLFLHEQIIGKSLLNCLLVMDVLRNHIKYFITCPHIFRFSSVRLSAYGSIALPSSSLSPQNSKTEMTVARMCWPFSAVFRGSNESVKVAERAKRKAAEAESLAAKKAAAVVNSKKETKDKEEKAKTALEREGFGHARSRSPRASRTRRLSRSRSPRHRR